tara:strand:+ start:13422 stop:13733 length:312 start_codon:yes stop_codon:yes gene_type:complete
MDRSNSSRLWLTSPPVIILVVLAFVATLVMLPSAVASWYSKCYNISLVYGFAIVFSSVLVGLISLIFPAEIRKYMQLFNGFVMACLVIYGVFLQFTGNCNLGK